MPRLAPPGQPIGVITIEDVIEELIRTEIVDETGGWVSSWGMCTAVQGYAGDSRDGQCSAAVERHSENCERQRCGDTSLPQRPLRSTPL